MLRKDPRRLKEEARRVAKEHGHRLGLFRYAGRGVYCAVCIHCGQPADVLETNNVVVGRATTVDCIYKKV